MEKDASSMIVLTMRGFLASSAAIGLIRARLSFQVQVSSAFDAGLAAFPLAHVCAIVAFMLLFAALPSCTSLFRKRSQTLFLLGILVSVIYGASLLFPSQRELMLTGIIVSDLFTAFAIRLWGDDNATNSVERIALRLGSSFVVQYIAYSAMLALPSSLRGLTTALLPLLIAYLLSQPPKMPAESGCSSLFDPALTKGIALLLLTTVGFSCIAHGILFCLPGGNSGTWILGPLAIAILVFACGSRITGIEFFRLVVCLTLGVQCLCAVPLLIFNYSEDVISFFRALSYSATMLLTMTVGCWEGAGKPNGAGRALCKWLLLYFVAFYSVSNILKIAALSDTILTALMLFCLVLSALPMAASSWKSLERTVVPVAGSAEATDVCRQKLSPSWGLTPRESEVLVLIASGRSAGEVASKLHVSKNTVRSQIRSIYQKLGVHTREELCERVFGDQ